MSDRLAFELGTSYDPGNPEVTKYVLAAHIDGLCSDEHCEPIEVLTFHVVTPRASNGQALLEVASNFLTEIALRTLAHKAIHQVPNHDGPIPHTV